MKKRTLIRHGELVLVPLEEADMQKAETKTNFIVSHSETGHHHVISGECEVLEKKGSDTLIQLYKSSDVYHKKDHDKHETLPVPEGIWRALKKKEYDPFQEVMREVWD